MSIRLLSIVTLSIYFIGCTPISKLYVKYGQSQPIMNQMNDEVIRICFDRKGSIYPPVEISDALIKECDSRLENLYEKKPPIYQSILQYYGLDPTTTKESLQHTLLMNAASQINTAAKGKKLVFIVHGFNKHPWTPRKASSTAENEVMRKKIEEQFKGQKFQFVEIYWDGCSWANGIKLFEATNSFKVWNNAQPASNNVGVELRRILTNLTQPEFYMVSHSLGASIVTCALFNVDKFASGNFRNGMLVKYTNDLIYKTPQHRIHLGLIAPAIPGKNTFDEFYTRTPAEITKSNNYSVVIGFNQYDRVLNKYLDMPSKMGSTTLGCVENELALAASEVNVGTAQLFSSTHFCRKANGRKQKDHAFAAYCENDYAMNDFLKRLFGD